MQEIDYLKKIPLFSCLHDQELEYLAENAIKKILPKDRTMLREGDVTDSLYVIQRGQVKTTKKDEHGKEIILSLFGSGDYFGEMAFIDGEPRSANIVTRENTEVWIFSREALNKIIRDQPGIVSNLLSGLIKRLRETNQKVESLAFMDVYGRVARLLTQNAEKQDDKMVIKEKMTHQEIANMIGSSREMVSKILKELTRGNYISIEKKMITIHKNLPYAF